MPELIQTAYGTYLTRNGIAHYQCNKGGQLPDALIDALKYRPEGPAWFWWDDSAAVIYPGDEEFDVYARWHEWRHAYAADPIAVNLLFAFMASPELTRRLPAVILANIVKPSRPKKEKE